MNVDITSNTPKIDVSNNSFLYISSSNISMAGRFPGEVMHSGSNLYTWDGNCWSELQSQHTIGLDYNTEAAIDWAVQKMQEEKDLDQMCEQFPALAKARDQFEMIKALVENDLKK